jgi:broad specificity phosphatase PhoE
MRPRTSGLLILIKHSLPAIVEHIPAADWTLSETGRQRSKFLAERLRRYQPLAVYSSQEIKAIETAGIVCQTLGLSSQPLDGLNEHDRRDAGYLERAVFEKHIRRFFANPDDLVYGNETADQARLRFTQTILPLLEACRGRNLAVVSHGTVITLFVSHLLSLEPFELWSSLALPSFLVLDAASKTLVARENIDERSLNGIH